MCSTAEAASTETLLDDEAALNHRSRWPDFAGLKWLVYRMHECQTRLSLVVQCDWSIMKISSSAT